MLKSNNPVGRLHEILSAFQKATANQNDRLDTIISRVFSVDLNDSSRLLEIYLELLNLTKECKTEIRKLPETSHELHLRAIKVIEHAFIANSLHSHWASFGKKLVAATMTGLDHTADNLSYLGEQNVSTNDLEDLQREVSELLELITKTEMNEKLRVFLVEHLEKIQQAVLYYRIKGARGLKDALERIIGAVYIYATENPNQKTPDSVKSKLSTVMGLLVKIVAFANDLKGLTGIDIFSLPRLP
jgi:alkyl hydroperoxide reductase subunit AhpC